MFSCHLGKVHGIYKGLATEFTQIHPGLDQQLLCRCALPLPSSPHSPQAPFLQKHHKKSLLSVVHSGIGGLILEATAKDTGSPGFYFQLQF